MEEVVKKPNVAFTPAVEETKKPRVFVAAGAERYARYLMKLIFVVISGMILIFLARLSYDFGTKVVTGEASGFALLGDLLHILIAAEVLHLTINYTLKLFIDPRHLMIVVLTAVGRQLIVTEVVFTDSLKLLALGVVLLIVTYAFKYVVEYVGCPFCNRRDRELG